ncbi:MAG: ribosome maturation factor RimP [Bradymonadia bacterium]|jgi:ribosome maturation factor RimP
MSTVDRSSLARQLEALARPITDELGVTLYDVEVGGPGGIVKITVDSIDGHLPGNGITVDKVTGAAKQIGYALEAEELIPYNYRLEVGSPGVERDLRQPWHFQAAVGQQVRVVLDVSATPGAEPVLTGTLSEATDTTATVTSGERAREFLLTDVRKARTVFDFGATPAQPSANKR